MVFVPPNGPPLASLVAKSLANFEWRSSCVVEAVKDGSYAALLLTIQLQWAVQVICIILNFALPLLIVGDRGEKKRRIAQDMNHKVCNLGKSVEAQWQVFPPIRQNVQVRILLEEIPLSYAHMHGSLCGSVVPSRFDPMDRTP